jgi:hypothetical protein
MWKSIKAIGSAVSDVSAIAGKEVAYQFGKAAEVSNSATSTLASRAASIRAKYEADLADRKAGIIKPTVVSESDIPKEAVAIN